MSTNIARVFVASTAYNFLNVFRSITPDPDLPYPLTENPVHCLEFAREETAELAFAILSSSLTFWLWHAEGDGFHVGACFIQGLPFGRSSFAPTKAEILRQAGRTLWHALQPNRIVSVNRGKQTIAYRPLACERERGAIDDVLLEAAQLPKSFKCSLREFVKSTVIVDKADRRRDRLKSLFNFMEDSP